MLLPLLALAAHAAPCDLAAWAAGPDDKATSLACMATLLVDAYGMTPDPEGLTLDPSYGSKHEILYTADQYRAMKGHLAAACTPGDPPDSCARAIEYLNGMIERRMSTMDACCAIEDAAPLYSKVLAGQALTAADLSLADNMTRWSPLTLWKLRNAVYARHGRTFQNPDLTAFFYGTEVFGRALTPDAAYTDASLSAADKANVTLIQSFEAKQK